MVCGQVKATTCRPLSLEYFKCQKFDDVRCRQILAELGAANGGIDQLLTSTSNMVEGNVLNSQTGADYTDQFNLSGIDAGEHENGKLELLKSYYQCILQTSSAARGFECKKNFTKMSRSKFLLICYDTGADHGSVNIDEINPDWK
jgi:hypothetical protein